MTTDLDLAEAESRSVELKRQNPEAPKPRTLEQIIADCAKVATVPDDAWDREQERMRLQEVRDGLEATIPRMLRWARFGPDGLLPLNPDGRRVATPDEARRSLAAVRCNHVVWMGPPTAGKSSLATAALRRWVSTTKRGAMFCPAHHLAVARIQHPAGHGEAPLVARAIAAPLLLIDDLGQGNSTTTDAVSDVIRDRVDQSRPLWVTTGLDLEQLKVKYDGGAMRRIFERAMWIQLAIAEGK